jgi:hypothetical protein
MRKISKRQIWNASGNFLLVTVLLLVRLLFLAISSSQIFGSMDGGGGNISTIENSAGSAAKSRGTVHDIIKIVSAIVRSKVNNVLLIEIF